MSKSFLHNPAVIDTLRKFRPLYARVFERRPAFGPQDEPGTVLKGLDGKAIFLLSFGRSGTTVFCDFLSSHPGILTLGEVLNEEAFRSYLKVLRRKRHGWRPSVAKYLFYRFVRDQVRRNPKYHVLFDMKFESLHVVEGNWRLPGPDFKLFDALIDSGNPVILLERRDSIARYLSHEVAGHRNVYHSFQKAEDNVPPLHIDIEVMDREVGMVRDQLAHVKKRFAGSSRFMAITYEEMFERDRLTGDSALSPVLAAKLAEMIGVPQQFDLAPRLERVAGGRTLDHIANRDAVEAYIARAKN